MHTLNNIEPGFKMVTFFGGGFHNVPSIKFMAWVWWIGEPDEPLQTMVRLTAAQKKKLDKHFCGVKGCTCHSSPKPIDRHCVVNGGDNRDTYDYYLPGKGGIYGV